MEREIDVKVVPLGVNGESGVEVALFRSKILLSRVEAEKLLMFLDLSLAKINGELDEVEGG